MKAQLKNTQMVNIELPEYFKYYQWSAHHYCRLVGDSIYEVSSGVYTRSTSSILDDLRKTELDQFSEITKEEFKDRLVDVLNMVIAEVSDDQSA